MAVNSQDWRQANIRMALSLYLGWAGADRFYSGQIGWGIVKAATFGGLLVWWLIDALYYSHQAGKAERPDGAGGGRTCAWVWACPTAGWA